MNSTIGKVREYVTKRMKEELSLDLCFHNWDHTSVVVSASHRIATTSQISEQDSEILMIAAWFHDLGFIHQYQDHEKESQKIAKSFLMSIHFDDKRLSEVISCIEATRMPQSPKTFLERILCDADMAHLGSPDYLNRLALLRKEWLIKLGKAFTDKQWYTENVNFLEQHKYFTLYAWGRYHAGKIKNISRLKNLISKSNWKPT
ncbi:MAG: hypothetical protein R2804_06125 [Cyclobacteriaceae bacterium]